MHPVLKFALATTAFAAVHSTFASQAAKSCAARIFGERRQRAFYRSFYIGQAVLSTMALAYYGVQVPARTLYKVQGPGALLLRMGQGVALVQVCLGAQEIGWRRITGIENMAAWARGEDPPRSPIAQGPEQDSRTGRLTEGGPFRWSRHPLNFLGVPLFWLTPHLTTKRLVFNLLSTLYFLLGSKHEEIRLRQAYGAQYRAYERSGVPFFFPRLRGRSVGAGTTVPQRQDSSHPGI